MAIGFWVINIVFVTFSHKIQFLKRMIPNQWVMFAAKGLVLGGSYFLYGELEDRAIRAHFERVYKVVEDEYRKYKNTGDILLFNPNIKIYDIFPDCEKNLTLLDTQPQESTPQSQLAPIISPIANPKVYWDVL